ncbi:hypothetical protein ACJX0J_017507, partial [Zea mays]
YCNHGLKITIKWNDFLAATKEGGVTPSLTLDGKWTPSKTTLFCLFVIHSCVIHVWGHTQIAVGTRMASYQDK